MVGDRNVAGTAGDRRRSQAAGHGRPTGRPWQEEDQEGLIDYHKNGTRSAEAVIRGCVGLINNTT